MGNCALVIPGLGQLCTVRRLEAGESLGTSMCVCGSLEVFRCSRPACLDRSGEAWWIQVEGMSAEEVWAEPLSHWVTMDSVNKLGSEMGRQSISWVPRGIMLWIPNRSLKKWSGVERWKCKILPQWWVAKNWWQNEEWEAGREEFVNALKETPLFGGNAHERGNDQERSWDLGGSLEWML